MCIPWICFYHVKKRLGAVWGYPALILFWISFEYIHLNWELSWPWLTMGNVFATHPGWVQWYEYTGTSGGTLWVLVVNLLFFLLLRQGLVRTSITRSDPGQTTPDHHIPGPPPPHNLIARYLIALFALLVALPFSSMLLTIPTETAIAAPKTDIVVVQPNIDPYEKFAPGNQEDELNKLIRLSESQIDSGTALVVWPETAISEPIEENHLGSNPFMAPVWGFLHRHPNLDLLSGVEGYRLFRAKNSTNSFKIPNTGEYEESYNSAALLDSNGAQIYHKSKFVPGVETLPSFLKFMAPLFDKFGGTTGGYVKQDDRTVLLTTNNTYRIAPSICYESIYGEFMSTYVRHGADLLVVITNDGWWGKTPGYLQHENYARLRAIETRRWVVHCANTGISCFIDPAGNVFDPQPWDRTAVLKKQVPSATTMTFYVRHGDLLSHLAIMLTLLLILYWLLISILKRKPRHG